MMTPLSMGASSPKRTRRGQGTPAPIIPNILPSPKVVQASPEPLPPLPLDLAQFSTCTAFLAQHAAASFSALLNTRRRLSHALCVEDRHLRCRIHTSSYLDLQRHEPSKSRDGHQVADLTPIRFPRRRYYQQRREATTALFPTASAHALRLSQH